MGPNSRLTRPAFLDPLVVLVVDLRYDNLFLGNLPVGVREVGPSPPLYRRRGHGFGRLACSFLVSLLSLISLSYRGGTKHV